MAPKKIVNVCIYLFFLYFASGCDDTTGTSSNAGGTVDSDVSRPGRPGLNIGGTQGESGGENGKHFRGVLDGT